MRRYSFLLPVLFIAISAVLFVTSYFCRRSKGYEEQAILASKYDAVPSMLPFGLPAVLLAVVRGPAVIFSSSDLNETRSLFLLPTGILWWWWVGAELEARRQSRRGSRLKASVYALLSAIVGAAAVFSIIASPAGDFWRYRYFELNSFEGAMFTADVAWFLAWAALAAIQSAHCFRSANRN
jgi:hypothetical protein